MWILWFSLPSSLSTRYDMAACTCTNDIYLVSQPLQLLTTMLHTHANPWIGSCQNSGLSQQSWVCPLVTAEKVYANFNPPGLLLAAGTWVIRGTLFLRNGGIVQNFGSVQEILFLEVALTESWVIFITRLSPGKDSGGFVWPSWQLVGAVLGVDILASIFALFGWISGSAPKSG